MNTEKEEPQARPSVIVDANTANTTSVSVTTKNGTAFIIIGHDGMIVTTNNLAVEVRT